MTDEKRGFFRSDLYLIIVALTVILTWTYGVPLIGIAVFLVLGAFLTFTQKGLTGAIPLIASVTFMFNDFDKVQTTGYLVGIVAAFVIMVILCLISVKRSKEGVRFSPALLGFLFLLAGAILGGTSNGMFGKPNWFIGISITLLLVVGYFALSNMIREFNPRFFAKIFVMIAVILITETWIFYSRQPDIVESIVKKDIRLGWGISNAIALTLTMVSPFIIYCAAKARFSLPYAALYFAAIITIYATSSRGCLLIITICALPVALTGVRMARYPKLMFLSLLLAAGACVFLFYQYKSDIQPIIERLYKYGLNDSGRLSLWKEAIENFKNSNFLTGTGFCYRQDLPLDEARITWYHDHYIQALSNFGVLGLFAMVFHVAQRFYYMIKKRTKFNTFALWGSLMVGMYGLIDVTYYTPYFLIPMIILLIMCENGSRKSVKVPTDEAYI